MIIRWFVYFCAALLLTHDVNAARSRGSHSYPRSGGLSGHGGSHSYPPSRGGLSGNSHGYPSGGLSGNSHGYPSSGGSHGYPSSGGSHGYPSSGGSHGYPASGGLSGNNNPGKINSVNTHTSHTTNVYNNYHYSPPQQIRYTPAHGAPMNYPVYHGAPPTYVYQYKDSGSKYGTLLAGLALLNLGTLAGTAYAVSHKSNNYKPQPGEVCKFGVRKDNNDYEETKIDCQLITSFILQEQNGGSNITTVTTTVTNVTMVNTTNGEAAPPPAETPAPGNTIYTMLANGTLVPLNVTYVNGTFINGTVNETSSETTPAPAANGSSSSVIVTTTTTNTTVTNALDVKGKPIDVTPGMQCYVIRTTPTSNMRKSVPCGLLQTYAEKSLKKNSASRNVPVFTIFAVMSALILAY